MKDNPEKEDAGEMDDAEMDYAMLDYIEMENPPFNLSYFVTLVIGDTAVKNAKFIETKFPKLSLLLTDIKDELIQEAIVDCGDTLYSMLSDVAYPQLLGLVTDLLFGNLPGGYVSMRGMLEAVVDSVVASIRFSDYPFPDDLEMLRQLELKHNINFRKKCALLLPKETNKQMRDNIYKLYDYLSKSWVHTKGLAKLLTEKRGSLPGWTMILPYLYDDDDMTKLHEFVQKLRELGEYIHELLQPTIKYFKTQAPNPP